MGEREITVVFAIVVIALVAVPLLVLLALAKLGALAREMEEVKRMLTAGRDLRARRNPEETKASVEEKKVPAIEPPKPKAVEAPQETAVCEPMATDRFWATIAAALLTADIVRRRKVVRLTGLGFLGLQGALHRHGFARDARPRGGFRGGRRSDGRRHVFK